MRGYIYCLSNPSFQDNIYKIGFTTKIPNVRTHDLYKTGLPTPFHIEFSKYVKNVRQTEHLLHEIFRRQRISSDREFFKVSLNLIHKEFEKINGRWGMRDKKGTTISNKPRGEYEKSTLMHSPSLRQRRLRRKCKKNVYEYRKQNQNAPTKK